MEEERAHPLTGQRVSAAIGLCGPLGVGLAMMSIALPHLNALFVLGFTISIVGAIATGWVGHAEIKKRTVAGILITIILLLDVVAPVAVLIYAISTAPGLPKISLQKVAFFWVKTSKQDTYRVGAVIEVFNEDPEAHLINEISFRKMSGITIGGGNFFLETLVAYQDRYSFVLDGYVKAGSEAYFKKLLPITSDWVSEGGPAPAFKFYGEWTLLVLPDVMNVASPFFAFYDRPISMKEWDDLLKPMSNININNLTYREMQR